ncbi:MAG: putative Ig domain-containing protein [Candidatus Atribacteria bacterium]|nr:putative Ig domain-containing protein [Candidatus Atribacteria bacterium]
MIIIKNKKLLLTLSTFLIVFLFTGCYLFNLPPVIESDPVTTAKEGVAYTYEVETTDPNGDTLTYSLTTSPTGMTINSTTGVISWTPTEAQIGANEVVVEVSDGRISATQSFTIGVDITLLTSIEVLPTSMSITAGSSKTITSVTAHYDNGTSESIALTACTYESNKPALITVSNGVISVSSTCTATTGIITVSHTEDGVTKNDTVTITVPASGGG